MTRFLRPAAIGAALLALAAVTACTREPSTPEAKKARGEELLRKMSAQLAGATSITFQAVQTFEDVRGDKRVPRTRTVTYAIRRPDKAHFTFAPESGGTTDMWYDGTAGKVTLAHHKEKAWARGPMPKTLDQALDAAATEYGINTPVADFLYSSPYEAFEQSGATGSWIAKETIAGQVCHHLSYQTAVVDWDLWLADGDRPLPCQLKIVYKQDEGKPSMTAVMKDWNLVATLSDDQFTPKVDEQAYSRVYLMRAATAEPLPDTAAEASAPVAGEASAPATPAQDKK